MKTIFFIWLVIALVALILEMGSPGLFFFLSFSFGALASAIVSLWYDSLVIQCSTFLMSTVLALLVLRLWVARWSKKYHAHARTNMYALQGKRAVVLERITPEKPGIVKVGGEVWTARAADYYIIETGVEVEVVAVSGAHVIVQKITE